jgi:2-iminobutanoate/2-iminopropanoate deaminase
VEDKVAGLSAKKVNDYNSPMPEVVQSGQLIYLSGVTPTVGGDVPTQTRNILEQVQQSLASAGSSLDRVVSVLVFIRAASDFGAMNDVYRTFWRGDFPTRTTIVVDLSRPEALVEMSLVAASAGADRTIVHPRDWVPSPSPYSYALRTGDTLFLSGLVSRNGRDNSVVTGDVGQQTRVILDNAGELLHAAGLSHANIVSSRVYLPDAGSFAAMNDAYRTYFPSAPPARATIRAALAGPQYAVEITVIASSAPRRVISEGLPPNWNLPLSPAVVAGDRAYLSGTLGHDETNRENAAAQTKATLEKLRKTLASSGASVTDVDEAIVYVTDPKNLPAIDGEYRSFFGGHNPSRTTVRCGLVAPDGLVEILFTARVKGR